MTTLNHFLAGATALSCLFVAMFFIRFWMRTRDRLFLFFSGAFLVFMIERLIRTTMAIESEWASYVYIARLVGFILIIGAVVDKNRRA